MDEQANQWRQLASSIAEWIAAQVEEADLDGTVVGVSGGIDSALAAALCRLAVGDRAWGLILPCHSAVEDINDAREVSDALGLSYRTIDLGPAFDSLMAGFDQLALTGDAGVEAGRNESEDAPSRLAIANIKPRLRMTALYYFANRHRLMVVGTSNRAETYVGYATKHGDAGVDIQPLSRLLKGEVRSLARELGIPERIVSRVPSAGLWQGQTDEGEMGLTYAQLDGYLATGQADPAVIARIEQLHRASEHKRRLPPQGPGLG